MAGKIDWDTIEEGTEVGSLTKPAITTTQLVKYAGASGDFNPIHYDKDFAQQAGLEGVIAHGMLTMAFVGQLATSWAWPENDLLSLTTRFRAMTLPGDQITCAGTVTRKYEEDGKRLLDVAIEAKNAKGEVTATGTATISVL